MFYSPFYHGLIKTYVVAFGSLFNDIYIVRNNSGGDEVQRMKVPLSYGSKELWLTRLRQDPKLERNVGIKLPRMGFQMTGLNYDASRKLNSNISRLRSKPNTNGVASRQFMGVPYTLNFDLDMYARNREDLLQIVEQIVPFFTPDYTVTVKTLPTLGITDDVPIVLTSTNTNDTAEGPLGTTGRTLTWTFQFQVMGMFYGPTRDKKIIKTVNVDSYVVPVGTDMTTPAHLVTEDNSRILTEDGGSALVAEGGSGLETAARVSRVTVTPDPTDGQIGDDFGFTTTIENFSDSQRQNDLTGEPEDLA